MLAQLELSAALPPSKRETTPLFGPSPADEFTHAQLDMMLRQLLSHGASVPASELHNYRGVPYLRIGLLNRNTRQPRQYGTACSYKSTSQFLIEYTDPTVIGCHIWYRGISSGLAMTRWVVPSPRGRAARSPVVAMRQLREDPSVTNS